MKISKTLGLIGVGNMGAAILEGLFAKQLIKHGQVWVYDKFTEKAREFSQFEKVRLAASNRELVQKSRVVLLAIKPQDLVQTAQEFKSVLTKEHTVISILAGTPVGKIKSILGPKPHVIRAMPNLGAKAGASMTVLSGKDPEGLKTAEQIFSGCGAVMHLDEKHFDLVTAISGSGPAYFFLLMELLVEAGIKNGIPREKAKLLAVQTALGAGLLAKASADAPDELRRKVTSKGGTTEAAFKVFESKQLAKIIHQGIEAAFQRGKELASF
ncbi:MAG: pyrroline-5-carboxylate reductase [Candidatus Omnitrophica bacterium]|nr:pyrroline-5-carboxylate reductase [Candidatus Omnitrophota bacterium]